MNRFLIVWTFALMVLGVKGSDLSGLGTYRPVSSMLEVGIGSSHLADTYLSPLKFEGWQMSACYSRLQAMRFSPYNWIMGLSVDGQFDRTLSPKQNTVIYYGGLNAQWKMLRRYRQSPELSCGVGGSPMLGVGCLLNQRNGNNPASAKASLLLAASGYVSYKLKIGGFRAAIRDDLDLPLAGLFFSPEYGELYYEIWLGNRHGLIHPAWWGNYFQIKNQLSADFNFGATTIRLGYKFGMLTSRINHLTTRFFRHSFVIGIGGDWLSLNHQKSLGDNVRIIMANY